MKTEVIEEAIAYSKANENIWITWTELKDSDIGTVWQKIYEGKRLDVTMVYQDESGCALLERFYAYPSEDGQFWHETHLIWFEFTN